MLFPCTPNPDFSVEVFQQPAYLHFSLLPGEWCVCLWVHSLMDNSNSIGLCKRTGHDIFADDKILNSSTQKVRCSCCCIHQFWILLILVIWRALLPTQFLASCSCQWPYPYYWALSFSKTGELHLHCQLGLSYPLSHAKGGLGKCCLSWTLCKESAVNNLTVSAPGFKSAALCPGTFWFASIDTAFATDKTEAAIVLYFWNWGIL